MTQSSRPPVDSSVPPGMETREVDDLHALYREVSAAEPGPALDAMILGAARAELSAARETSLRSTPPWWKRWLPATSAIAVAVLGLSITLRMVDQGGLETRATFDEADTPLAKSAESPATPAVVAPVPASAPAPAAQQSELPTGASAAPEPLRQRAVAASAKKQERVERLLSAPLEARADKAASAGMAVEGSDALEAEAPDAAGAKAPPAVVDEVAEVADAALSPADENRLTPTAWLERIRALQTAGRIDEARQSLDRFKKRFPDHVLPADFTNLK